MQAAWSKAGEPSAATLGPTGGPGGGEGGRSGAGRARRDLAGAATILMAAFMLSRLSHSAKGPTPIGVFRDVDRPVYDDLMAAQLDKAVAKQGAGDLTKLLHSGDTWEID